MNDWTNWKPFPHASARHGIEAPQGAGVYEVRHMQTGELMAFGHAKRVEQALAKLREARSSLFSFFSAPLRGPLHEMEYRIHPARDFAEARVIANHMNERREAFMRRRG